MNWILSEIVLKLWFSLARRSNLVFYKIRVLWKRCSVMKKWVESNKLFFLSIPNLFFVHFCIFTTSMQFAKYFDRRSKIIWAIKLKLDNWIRKGKSLSNQTNAYGANPITKLPQIRQNVIITTFIHSNKQIYNIWVNAWSKLP